MPTRDFVARLEEWAAWYHQHKNDFPDGHHGLTQELAFLRTAIDGLMELMALAAREKILGEGRQSRLIYTPRGMYLESDGQSYSEKLRGG